MKRALHLLGTDWGKSSDGKLPASSSLSGSSSALWAGHGQGRFSLPSLRLGWAKLATVMAGGRRGRWPGSL
eukprot:7618095-Alexandrium_andersonii.AAC.1